MKIPETVAIIMDGNGRWAKKRGLPRSAGHKKGADMIREIGLAANELGIKKCILYAFSTENWKRPEDEVGYLCKLPGMFFDRYMKELMANNIRVTFIGELERFPSDTQKVIQKAVQLSQNNTGLNLCLAINYGARREMVLGIQKYAQQVKEQKRENDLTIEEFSDYLFVKEEVDLMIRTSGEVRLSNFLLWQVAYSEFIFTPVPWPEFDRQCLIDCIKEFNERDRRYGGLNS
ncbi:MAG: isoprenyl transferase [Floccifex porci]|mgnify:FL=1|uniref:Isoprenyl transferase n=1 Tax=Floccifex porci TaxID=2606629 RepID=A0A7X2N3I7_9FIRM|nr:isoprenyl transferase [Floccifex porci]MCI7802690.1 isoprenyl transferase [Erysipelotrichaceae bacterium]MDD7467005.1 isoprenyl transferase [Floccifex porci]MDO4479574.1 isoprenyl transferase [Erysipelotrichaceae bacterium]MDY4797562.1 isoprenyl transferase [Floccifex porci]MSS01829.1 isoprenyl transferase [Floccifex porci]